ncbi:pirin family protein [Providencia sp. PAZ2]|uniref:pirin family protein n=1 Tax=Providencia lanzhouensis TaxID=3378099 RepID=UPI003D27AE92
MMKLRSVNHCGKADYGWLQARYTFSFGHYFDPDLMGFKTLKVLNQEVLAPDNAFQPRVYPHVDIVNIILQGQAEYRDNLGNTVSAKAGECVSFSPRPDLSYSEHNTSETTPLTRLQLWLNACPQQESMPPQKLALAEKDNKLIASPDGDDNSLQLRQKIWISQICLEPNESKTLALRGKNAYLQSIHGGLQVSGKESQSLSMSCNDGLFIQDENSLTLTSYRAFRGLLIDLGESL